MPKTKLYSRNYPAYKFKTFIAAFGNNAEIQDIIRDSGFEPPPIATIQGWRDRNSIPGKWLPILLMYAVSTGFLPDIGTLIDGVPIPKRQTRKPKAL